LGQCGLDLFQFVFGHRGLLLGLRQLDHLR
jgi:hypothetical protein